MMRVRGSGRRRGSYELPIVLAVCSRTPGALSFNACKKKKKKKKVHVNMSLTEIQTSGILSGEHFAKTVKEHVRDHNLQGNLPRQSSQLYQQIGHRKYV
jgi:hypothetical protein